METHCMHNRSNKMKRVVFGLLVITTGVLWMLRNMQILDEQTAQVIFSWPMLLLGIGFMNLFGHGRLFGVILMAIGGFYLASNFYNIPLEFRQIFWPGLFIVIGLFIVFKAGHVFRYRKFNDNEPRSNDLLDEVNVFGGSEFRVYSQQFQGGKITAVFGGSKIILSDCELAEGDNILEISAVFGGFKLIVPAHWNVKVEMASVLGGVADKRMPQGAIDTSRTLVIKGSAVFGGGEITSII